MPLLEHLVHRITGTEAFFDKSLIIIILLQYLCITYHLVLLITAYIEKEPWYLITL